MKKKQIISELRQVAEIFGIHRYDNASKWITFIADNIENNRLSDYKKDFFEMYDAFKSEICRDDYAKTIYDQIELILGTALNVQREQRFNDILVQSWPLIHNWRKTRENVDKMKGILIKQDRPEAAVEKNFYILLFIYLLEVEGSFDDIMRTIYILALASRNRQIDYQRIYNKRLSEIKAKLIELGLSDAFFMGWENGHLRNAIAHARFSFDKTTGKMSFVDIIPWTNRTVYNEEFTFQEFAQRGKMVEYVPHILGSFLMIIRILDLVKFKWVRKPRKAK